MTKMITYCLWGEDPKYINGLKRNIATIKEKLSDYEIMVAVNLYSDFKNEDVTVYRAPQDYYDHYLMYCRLFPASWDWIDVVYSKDLDSPILNREIEAMKEFEKSDKSFLIMRDHPLHTCRIVGGMLGIKKNTVSNMCRLIHESKERYKNEWYCDQHFLEDIIYPLVRDRALIYDSFRLYPDEINIAHDFPTFRTGDEFVGMIINADGSRIEKHHRLLNIKK